MGSKAIVEFYRLTVTTYRFRATLICRPSSSLNGPVGRRDGFLIEIKMIVFFTVFSSLSQVLGWGE